MFFLVHNLTRLKSDYFAPKDGICLSRCRHL